MHTQKNVIVQYEQKTLGREQKTLGREHFTRCLPRKQLTSPLTGCHVTEGDIPKLTNCSV